MALGSVNAVFPLAESPVPPLIAVVGGAGGVTESLVRLRHDREVENAADPVLRLGLLVAGYVQVIDTSLSLGDTE